MDTDGAQPLPGLEALTADRPVGYVESGVRRTIAALDVDQRLAELDAGHLAVAVALSRIIAQKEARGRLSTVSNDAKLLIEILDAWIRPTAEGTVDQSLREAMAQFQELADEAERQAAAEAQARRT